MDKSIIPQQYLDCVGTTVTLSGGVFSGKKAIPETEFLVKDIRRGSATIINFTELKETGKSSYEHPTYELLVKNEMMKKSRWTRGFPIREINFKNQEAKDSEVPNE